MKADKASTAGTKTTTKTTKTKTNATLRVARPAATKTAARAAAPRPTTPRAATRRAPAPVSPDPAAVAVRAYALFEERQWAHGRDIDDWLQAETELMTVAAASAPKPRRRKVADGA